MDTITQVHEDAIGTDEPIGIDPAVAARLIESGALRLRAIINEFEAQPGREAEVLEALSL